MAMSTRATRSSRKAPSKSPVKSQLIPPKCDEEESESDTDLDALVSTAVDGVRQKYGHEDTNFSGLGFVIDKTPGANNILEDTKSDEDETDSESEEETSVKKSSDTSSNKSNRRQKGKNERYTIKKGLDENHICLGF